MTSKLFILDLDETLIYATRQGSLARPPDFELGSYRVFLRPYVSEFLGFCTSHFRVAIWTSSSEDYAEAIVSKLFGRSYPLEFLWARKRCTRRFNAEDLNYEWVKDLKKVKRRGFSLEQVIMVDDTPRKLARNYGNLVYVRPFEGDVEDKELLVLMPYLLELKSAPNIRGVDKRGWRLRSGTKHLTLVGTAGSER